jgi:hypothetical protein
MSPVRRFKCLTHQNFHKKLPGETARIFKFLVRQNGLLEARMMPARVQNFGARAQACGAASASCATCVARW